jgi:hypothetical protein
VGADLHTRPPDRQDASPRGTRAVLAPSGPSNVSRRVRRNRFLWSQALLAFVGYGISRIGGGTPGLPGTTPHPLRPPGPAGPPAPGLTAELSSDSD